MLLIFRSLPFSGRSWRVQTLLQNSWLCIKVLCTSKKRHICFCSLPLSVFLSHYFSTSVFLQKRGEKKEKKKLGAKNEFSPHDEYELKMQIKSWFCFCTSFTPFQKLCRFEKNCNTHFYTQIFLFIYTRKISSVAKFTFLRRAVYFMPRNFL